MGDCLDSLGINEGPQVTVRLNLIDLLMSGELSHLQKITLLHLYNKCGMATDIRKDLKVSKAQWYNGLRKWVNGKELHEESYITGCGIATPDGFELLNKILYLPYCPATKIVLLYVHCRSRLKSWVWSREEIFKSLHITRHTWHYHIKNELLRNGNIAYRTRDGVTRITLIPIPISRFPKPSPLESSNKIITLSGVNLTYPQVQQAITKPCSLNKIAELVKIKASVVWRYVKKFGHAVVKDKLDRLVGVMSRLTIRSPAGWLWNACKQNWSNTWNPASFMPDKPKSPEIAYPVRGTRETDEMLEKIFRPPSVRPPLEEELAKQLAEEAKAALREKLKPWWGSTKQQTVPTRKKGSIPTLADILGVGIMKLLG